MEEDALVQQAASWSDKKACYYNKLSGRKNKSILCVLDFLIIQKMKIGKIFSFYNNRMLCQQSGFVIKCHYICTLDFKVWPFFGFSPMFYNLLYISRLIVYYKCYLLLHFVTNFTKECYSWRSKNCHREEKPNTNPLRNSFVSRYCWVPFNFTIDVIFCNNIFNCYEREY